MNQQNKTWSCAISGLGRIASLLENDSLREKPCTHAGAIADNGRLRLAAGCDTDGSRAETFAGTWKDARIFSDTGTMLDTVKPDVLVVAVGEEAHETVLMEGLSRNVPLILCEKPLTDSLKGARRVMKAAGKSSSLVMLNYERRFSLDYRYLKTLIGEKKYGDLRSVDARVFMGTTRKSEGILAHDSTHMFDIIGYLTGTKLDVVSVGVPPGKKGRTKEERALADIDCSLSAAGIPVRVVTGTAREYLEFSLDLWFSLGMCRIGNGIFEEYGAQPSTLYQNFKSLRKTPSPDFSATNYFRGVYAEIVDLLDNPGKTPVSGLTEGYASVEIVERILRTAMRISRI
jgi:predicted dehydrogenase